MGKPTDINSIARGLTLPADTLSSVGRAARGLGSLNSITNIEGSINSAQRLFRELNAANEMRDTLRAAAMGFTGVNAASRLFEDIYAAQRAILESPAFIGSSAKQVAELRKNVLALSKGGTLSATGRLMHDLDRQSREAASLMSELGQFNSLRFAIPDTSSLLSLSKEATSAIASLGLGTQGLADAMASMRTPWLDLSNQVVSAHAFAQLQSIGAGLSSLQPFSQDFSRSLRDLLGDWRDPVSFTPDIIEYEVRARVYEEHGFDDRLIDFPDEAFDEALIISGISHRVVVADDDVSVEDAESFAATNDLHLYITQLENSLRRAIVRILHTMHGDRWHKVGLPSGMYDAWLSKKAEDRSGNELEPIEYSDFTDYERIIVMKPNWPGFSVMFERKESVQESFYRLHPARLATMHARALGRADVLFAMVEIHRLMRGLRGKS